MTPDDQTDPDLERFPEENTGQYHVRLTRHQIEIEESVLQQQTKIIRLLVWGMILGFLVLVVGLVAVAGRSLGLELTEQSLHITGGN